MNNIEILEELVERCKECKFACCEQCEINWKEVQAIENLLENSKKIIELNYIPKSKIKEKIEAKISCCKAEELEDNYIGDKHSQYWKMYRELLEKLEQELLEEGE